MHLKTMFRTGAALLGGLVAEALGGWDAALQTLVCVMAADYVTGLLVAALWRKSKKTVSGGLDSEICYKGLVKKGMMLVLVWLGAMLDTVTGSGFVRTAVCLFFIANESLSILENTALMGVPYPAAVKNMLEVMKQQAGEGAGHG